MFRIKVIIASFLLLCPTEEVSLQADSSEVSGNTSFTAFPVFMQDPDMQMKDLIVRVENAFSNGQTDQIYYLTERIKILLGSGNISDSALLARANYYAGASLAYINKARESFNYFGKAMEILNRHPDDTLKSRIIYFMGYAANITGDHLASDNYFNQALAIKKKIYGENSAELITSYVSSAIAKINIRDFEGAKLLTDEILDKIRRNLIMPSPSELAFLYQNRGIALANLSEQRQALLNMLKSLEIHETFRLPVDDNRLNLLNNIATTYYYLKEYDRCIEYYEKGLKYTHDIRSVHARDLAVNYALILGQMGYIERGSQILDDLYKRFLSRYGEESSESAEIALYYADYSRLYRFDKSKYLHLFRHCYNYAASHQWNANFISRLSLGYSLYLIDQGQFKAAHDTVAIQLFRNSGLNLSDNLYSNPDQALLHNDKTTIDLLKVKYIALEKLYDREKQIKYLDLAVETIALMVTVIDNMRFRLGEEESRIMLGERFRETYLLGIAVNLKCYDLTLNPDYLEKAFTYTEKGKAASLLTSVRENFGIKYHVPEKLATMERETRLKIGFFESKIAENNNLPQPDGNVNMTFSNLLLDELARKDSLMTVIKEKYPGYYSYKYNNRVLNTGDVIRETGKKSDFISYVAGDTILYIVLLNSNSKIIKAVNIDTGFYGKVKVFRQMLSEPVTEGDIRSSFIRMQQTGYELYKYLIEPVRQYLISDNLIISPDRELVLFPFEALLSSFNSDTSLYYSRLPFLFMEYNISYTYSATLLAETGRRGKSLFNRAVVFAPEYKGPISTDSADLIQDLPGMILMPLRYAGQEAVYVKKITGARLFTGSYATADNFRKEVENHNIIHLALHTVIDERSPLNSGLYFSDPDSTGDKSVLSLYEIPELTLNARMVVLSSCRTGSGRLLSGEGVLSVAREFIKAGSSSVIMSLWEVDDRAGAEIMKIFYRKIRSGSKKSTALRKSREKYLETADMKHSMPYYWLNIVVYGDDSRVYRPLYLKTGILIILISLIAVIRIYFRKR